VCGASGVGKSRIAGRLARRYRVPVAEADDIVTALAALTSPAEAPELHLWDTNPEVRSWPPERIAEQHFRLADALRPGFIAVIEDHLEFGAPILFEGDYLTPELARDLGSDVRSVVVSEPDEDRLVANLEAREAGDQGRRLRAAVSMLVEAELVRRAAQAGAPVVPSRPWGNAPERVDRALRGV
jgi:2-phosphoglycerate kinase